jgi:hypothetical protein
VTEVLDHSRSLGVTPRAAAIAMAAERADALAQDPRNF